MLVKKYFVVERISVRVKWFGVKFYFFFILVLSGGIATASEQSLEQAVNIEQSASTEQPSILFVPAFSYFIPGLGSFIDGDYSRAFKFLGYGAIGLGIAKSTQERIDDFEKNNPRESHHHRDLIRENQIGGMMVAHSRMLSVYDSFSHRAEQLKASGKYLFLPEYQNTESILKAPFEFGYLRRWTTLVPFSFAILAGYSELNRGPKPDKFDLRPIEVAAGSYVSYVAGTGEEAFFRGWMYPVLYENTGSLLISNLVQGTLFGMAHGPDSYPQMAFGFYTGWLTARNNFDLGEAIFIHAWWDFWILTASFIRSRSFTQDYSFHLPPFQISF